MEKFKVALCQIKVTEDKEANIKKAEEYITKAAKEGAKLVALPEMFNCPYSNNYFRSYAEEYPDGKTMKMLKRISKELGIYLIGGSIPEFEDGKVYNTSFIFSNEGELLGKHRKAHLFDINVEGGIRFMESETLDRGNKATVIDTPLGKIGVAICYDMRFPEFIRTMSLRGPQLVILPAAFNMTTGPAHWELTIRARSLDNQIYMAAVSPARDYDSCYIAFGHTMVSDPWGQIIASAGEGEEIVYFEFDSERVSKIRRELPLLKHRRKELYEL